MNPLAPHACVTCNADVCTHVHDALVKTTRERDDIAAWAESWMKRVAAAERERDEARAAALVAVEERRSFQKAHDLSERHRGPLERVRSAAYDLFQALDWEAPEWRDETCAERGDATNKAWFELEAALDFAAECDSSHSRPSPPAYAATEAVEMLRHLCNVYGCTSYGRTPDHGPDDCSWCEAEALLAALAPKGEDRG